MTPAPSRVNREALSAAVVALALADGNCKVELPNTQYEGQKRHLATFYSVPGSRMDRNRVLLLADTIQAIRLKLHAQRKAAK